MAEETRVSESTLQRLSESDLQVADDDPDVRGWDVVLADGTSIGEVDDLIVDTSAMKVRYVDVDLDSDALKFEGSRHALVPIERADLDTTDKAVLLRGLTRESVLQLPDSDGTYGENHRAAYETHAPRASAASDTAVSAAERTRLTRSAEELRVGTRSVKAGEVHIGKHVETEHVSQPVTRTRERVVVERRPVTAGSSASSRIENDEIVVPVMEEEVIVEKRPVVKEELVIAKERVQEQETVQADLRREEFDVRGSREDLVSGERTSPNKERK